MTEFSEKKAQEWTDQEPDEEEPEDYEKTYRDGTPIHECWDDREA